MKYPPPLAWLSLLAFLLLFVPAPALAAALNVYWNPNTELDLEGYLLFWGTASGQYGDPVFVPAHETSYRLAGLSPDTLYYVALKAVNTLGLESPLSEEASAWTNPEPSGDGDALPDDWEVRFGLDPDDPSDDLRDLDRDGYTNLAEYEGDTDPTDSRSIPGEPVLRRLEATIIAYRPGCVMRAFNDSAGLVWTCEAREVSVSYWWGAVRRTFTAQLDIPCGLRVELEFVDGEGIRHPLYFFSDLRRTFLTTYIKVSPYQGGLGPVSLGEVKYYSGIASCSSNPLRQLDRDDDGVADYDDLDYLDYLSSH